MNEDTNKKGQKSNSTQNGYMFDESLKNFLDFQNFQQKLSKLRIDALRYEYDCNPLCLIHGEIVKLISFLSIFSSPSSLYISVSIGRRERRNLLLPLACACVHVQESEEQMKNVASPPPPLRHAHTRVGE